MKQSGKAFSISKEYAFDDKFGIWRKTHSSDLKYSDGDETEERIYQVLKEAGDISLSSDELPAAISDWATECHFTRSRHNLLRPFTFSDGDKILELGCGCGAITRQLGESGATVIAVDGSERRSIITAERCRDLSNVAVVCDNIGEFVSEEKFAVVTLIGVLEYAQIYCPGTDAVQRFLQLAHAYLTENGVLILAIENQIGLKYFNGCGEDHLGIPFFGINDLYQDDTAITFGKKELSSRLKSAGFREFDFYYPFPDYKIPTIIISEEGLRNDKLRVGDLLSQCYSRDYGGRDSRSFDENLAWQVLSRNDLVGNLCNSFLVFAGKEEGSTSDRRGDWLAKSYSTSRRSCFATENSFEVLQNEIVVRKKTIFETNTKTSMGDVNRRGFYHIVGDVKYTAGRLLLTDLYHIAARGGDSDQIADWAKPWLDFLTAKAIDNGCAEKRFDLSSLYLPGRYIDCIPFNILVNEDGDVVYFDDEWGCNAPIPLHWVVVRGIANALYHCPRRSQGVTFRQVLDEVLPKLELNLDEAKYEEMGILEYSFREFCYGNSKREEEGDYVSMLNVPFGLYCTTFDKIDAMSHQVFEKDRQLAENHHQLAEKDRQIHALLNSWSWKITAPLRALRGLMK